MSMSNIKVLFHPDCPVVSSPLSNTTAISTKPTAVVEPTTVTSTTTLAVPRSPSACSMPSPQAIQCPYLLKIRIIQPESPSSNKDYGRQDPIQALCPSNDFTFTTIYLPMLVELAVLREFLNSNLD
ncbi:hypothetical protein BB560_003033 [Smittium megazygosporum]|uniref:Uncharacterized protein n=1 Tax=Smittium megazygosporum TaxID=133381 RepID=A0A2T9ZD51_9FUNG|nr:hypothetical protein BB560_003033 [Smittium megazygosporum]